MVLKRYIFNYEIKTIKIYAKQISQRWSNAVLYKHRMNLSKKMSKPNKLPVKFTKKL